MQQMFNKYMSSEYRNKARKYVYMRVINLIQLDVIGLSLALVCRVVWVGAPFRDNVTDCSVVLLLWQPILTS